MTPLPVRDGSWFWAMERASNGHIVARRRYTHLIVYLSEDDMLVWHDLTENEDAKACCFELEDMHALDWFVRVDVMKQRKEKAS